MSEQVVIVGAGLAGLACACKLKEKGIEALILEASDQVGGRVRTDRVDGFLLDRGFQVLLTAYPETRRLLDSSALELSSFISGAMIRSDSKWLTVADPTRHPTQLLATALADVGSIADRLRILRLRHGVCKPSMDSLLQNSDVSTAARLRELGFSARIMRQFFRPFLGGIFLETELATSSRKFEFVFCMFSEGTAALPKAGMAAIPQQLAKRLSPQQIRLQQEVASIDRSGVRLATGAEIAADTVVLATDVWSANGLLHNPSTLEPATATCLYFAAGRSPVEGPWLVLNGEGAGPVNNLCVPSELHRSYAPEGQSLISVTVLDQQYRERNDLQQLVRSQLSGWYGPTVEQWRFLKAYRIENAVPVQTAGSLAELEKPVKLRDGLFCCGDHKGIASIEGAIRSGVRTAAALSS